jgi:hypothetical protein
MEPGIRAEHCEIIDLRMACKSTEAGNDRVISDLAVMADMRAVHEIVVIADTRAAPATRGTHMDRDLFSNLCPYTNLETGRFAVEGPVLWFGPEARVRKDSTIGPDIRPTKKGDVGADFDPKPEFDLASYERERTDHHTVGENRSVFDACGWMDVGQGLSPFR